MNRSKLNEKRIAKLRKVVIDNDVYYLAPISLKTQLKLEALSKLEKNQENALKAFATALQGSLCDEAGVLTFNTVEDLEDNLDADVALKLLESVNTVSDTEVNEAKKD